MCTTYVLCSILINRHRIVLDPGEITQDVVDNVLDRVQLRTLGVLRNPCEVAFPHVPQIVDAVCPGGSTVRHHASSSGSVASLAR
jgi:hypothetical protein